MRLVIVESPFNGSPAEIIENRAYARRCMMDCLNRGEAPFASHLLYTQVLDDNDKLQRDKGMEAGFCWGAHAEACVVYIDRGISGGMQLGIMKAKKNGLVIEYRQLPPYFIIERP